MTTATGTATGTSGTSGTSAISATGTPTGPPAAVRAAPSTATSLSARPSARPVSASALPAGTLLVLARRGLVEAAAAATPGERYAAAHLSALRVAAAVLACRARPERGTPSVRRARPTSAWVLLAVVAPELAEWAAFFAAGATKRANAEAGLPSAVTAREADDLLRDAEAFLVMVEGSVGLRGPASQLLLASG